MKHRYTAVLLSLLLLLSGCKSGETTVENTTALSQTIPATSTSAPAITTQTTPVTTVPSPATDDLPPATDGENATTDEPIVLPIEVPAELTALAV